MLIYFNILTLNRKIVTVYEIVLCRFDDAVSFCGFHSGLGSYFDPADSLLCAQF